MLLIKFSEDSCHPAPRVASTVIHAGSLSKSTDEYADTRPPLIVLPEVHWKWGGRARVLTAALLCLIYVVMEITIISAAFNPWSSACPGRWGVSVAGVLPAQGLRVWSCCPEPAHLACTDLLHLGQDTELAQHSGKFGSVFCFIMKALIWNPFRYLRSLKTGVYIILKMWALVFLSLQFPTAAVQWHGLTSLLCCQAPALQGGAWMSRDYLCRPESRYMEDHK